MIVVVRPQVVPAPNPDRCRYDHSRGIFAFRSRPRSLNWYGPQSGRFKGLPGGRPVESWGFYGSITPPTDALAEVTINGSVFGDPIRVDPPAHPAGTAPPAMSAEVTTGRGAVRSRVCDELLPAANAHQSKLIGATYQGVPFIGLSASDRRSAGP